MNTLTLVLQKIWFELIKLGIKSEEYREIKDHYFSLFFKMDWVKKDLKRAGKPCKTKDARDYLRKMIEQGYFKLIQSYLKNFENVVFANGYKKDRKKIEFRKPKIDVRSGKEEWGAKPGKIYFVITWEK